MHRRAGALDEEEVQMAVTIRNRGKASLKGRPEGIRSLWITCTEKEKEDFQKRSDMMKSKSLPFFTCMLEPLGGQTYVWYEMCMNNKDFITSIQLSHQKIDHTLNRSEELTKKGYTPVKNPKISLELWIIALIAQARGIKELGISSTEAEEEVLAKNGFEKTSLSQSLDNYGIGGTDTFLWMKYVSKVDNVGVGGQVAATNDIINEAMQGMYILYYCSCSC